MRSLKRRKQRIWLCTSSVEDSHIEQRTIYSKPVEYKVTVSNTSGTPHELPVGVVSEYSRYFISFDRNIVVKEGMLAFIDRVPELDANGEIILNEKGNPNVKPDYVVTHIMDTKQGTIARYGIKRIAGDESETEDEEGVYDGTDD